LLAVLVAAGCATKQTFDEPAVLDETLRASLPALIGDARPRAILASLVIANDLESTKIKVVSSQSQASLTPDDIGLWRVVSNTKHANGSASAGELLTLCGLAPLLNTAGTSTSRSTETLAPTGKATIPLFFSTTTETARRWRAKTFTTTAKHICMPEPGESFSYHVEVDTAFKSSNPFARSRTDEIVQDVSCRVGTEVRPANQVAGPFRGDALAVSCERSDAEGGVIKTEYAFLRDSLFYVPLREVYPQMTVTRRYDAVTYRP
jgi:hypothetical protein